MNGIYAVERSRLNEVARGVTTGVVSFALGASDGIPNVETNGGENQPAGWKSRDGRLWFPTMGGVVVFDPKAFPINEPPPTVLIVEVKANNELVPTSQTSAASGVAEKVWQVKIAPGGGRVVEVKFTANTFVEPERSIFRYRLKGADPQWHEQTGDRTARFYNLKPAIIDSRCWRETIIMCGRRRRQWSNLR